MLNHYLQQTQQLLADINQQVFNPGFLIRYINTARGQVAGEGRCILAIGIIPTVVGQRNYNFSSINLGTPSVTGIQGTINVRRIMFSIASGFKWIKNKSWEWFDFQRLNNPVPPSGQPTEWAQFGQGSAGLGGITGIGPATMASGSFFIDPIPDAIYSLNCVCECYPQALLLDTDVEALPYLWSDAVPYYAAYNALMTIPGKQQDAQQMFQVYETFVRRARMMANPEQNQFNFAQGQDPAMAGRFGMTSQGATNGA